MENNAAIEWEQFLSNIEDYSKHPEERWNMVTFLSYFLVKYKEMYGVDFIFTSGKRGPLSSKPMNDAKKIWTAFDRGRLQLIEDNEQKIEYKKHLVEVLKNYVDWIFNIKVKNGNLKITSLGIMVVPNVMNEFLQFHKKNKNQVKRDTPIPESLLQEIRNIVPEIFNMHQLHIMQDLNRIIEYSKAYNLTDETAEGRVIKLAKDKNILVGEKLEFSK